jgi:hypothetical protein
MDFFKLVNRARQEIVVRIKRVQFEKNNFLTTVLLHILLFTDRLVHVLFDVIACFKKFRVFNFYRQCNQLPQTAYSNDSANSELQKIIHIKNEDDLYYKQAALIAYIWKYNFLPKDMPVYESKENIKGLSCDKFYINMDYGFKTRLFLYKPQSQKNSLQVMPHSNKYIIFHGGHGNLAYNEHKIISYFLSKGVSVLAIDMPMYGRNHHPEFIKTTNMGLIRCNNHQVFSLVENKNFSAIKLFLHPTISAINFLFDITNDPDILMFGLSGGGMDKYIMCRN